MVFGLLEKDVLCATMAVTTTMGVDLGFSWVFLGVFPFDFLSYSCYNENHKDTSPSGGIVSSSYMGKGQKVKHQTHHSNQPP